MLRLFICIWIPDEIKQNILDFQEKLKSLPLNAKFVEKENLHLTVNFLGYVDRDKIDETKAKIGDSIRDFNEFHVKLAGLKVIPSENYIRVIGIDVIDEDKKLEGLIKSIGNNLGGSFHEKTKMTLCRVKNVQDKNKVRDFIEEHKNVSFGEFTVNKISLVKSTLTENGPIYETIHEFILK